MRDAKAEKQTGKMQRNVAIAWKYQGTVTKERILHKL